MPRSELIAGVEHGLLVTSTRNVGGVNAVNGDYSVGAAGVWLENGQETAPVSGVTIAASIGEMLHGLVAAGDDLRWIPAGGVLGCPTIRIEGMTIAGS
jgi:PmbA protein